MGTTEIKKSASPLSVDVAGLELANPVLTASGTFGYGLEFARWTDLNRLGGVVVKGLSLKPRQGNPAPRIVETPCGMLNAIGLQNVGVEAFVRDKLPPLRGYSTKVVANIFGEKVEEYAEVASILDREEGVHALEINISCPNVKKGGIVFGTDPNEAARVVEAVKKSVRRLPVITKLSPNVTDVRVMARAVEAAGSDAISLINTITGMVVDVDRRRAVLATKTGGLSGPAIRPVAVRMVWEAARSVNVPVIGMGGIVTARDALEFIIAGATAVQVGTASFITPDSAARVVDGIEEYVREHGTTVRDLVGSIEE